MAVAGRDRGQMEDLQARLNEDPTTSFMDVTQKRAKKLSRQRDSGNNKNHWGRKAAVACVGRNAVWLTYPAQPASLPQGTVGGGAQAAIRFLEGK